MKTIIPSLKRIEPRWYVVDVAQKTLGRVAAQIASHLRGKNTPNFTPHLLIGPRIIAINVEKIHVTGRKREHKVYNRYTGYPSGLKSECFEKLLARFPERILQKAVKGMLPKNPLGRAAFKRLHVYKGGVHPHTPQSPKILVLD